MGFTVNYEPETVYVSVENTGTPADYDFVVPKYANHTDAGADLKSSVDMVVPAREWALVPTGVKIALPEGFAGFVHPRSGLALKHGITVLNAPGTIDADYRGELKVILINHSDEDFLIKQYDRIAQLVVQRVESVVFDRAYYGLSETGRGEGGFGSTGVN